MGYFASLYSSELPHRAVTVYMYLRDRCDKDGKCYPAIGTIASELKLSRSTVRAAPQGAAVAGKWRQEQLHVFCALIGPMGKKVRIFI